MRGCGAFKQIELRRMREEKSGLKKENWWDSEGRIRIQGERKR